MSQIPLLLGGLALFLYGMNQMGKGLELLAGNKLQGILEKLTNKKLLGILVGAIVTAIIQSSSATTVMAVGFVSSKILTLTQAVYIIMGANIGTTVTGLLLTLDIDLIAPFFAFIGMVMQLFIKKRKYKYAGTIIFGFGVLFMGMDIMGNAVKPLSENPTFINIIAGARNPFVGIIIGALFTAIIQSSSATTGILITLALNGLLTFDVAFYLVLGQNIGTCITSVLASMGASKNAKRVAVTHVTFNLIGVIIFATLSFILPIKPWIESWSNEISLQIAYMHTFFNVVTTILLIPFTNLLVKVSHTVVKGEDAKDSGLKLLYINPTLYHDAIITLPSIKQEILRMLDYAKSNLKMSIQNILEFDEDNSADLEYNEEVIDYLNTEITRISVKTMTNNLSKTQYKHLSYYLKICSNIERLGDYAYNINALSKDMYDKKMKFTNPGQQEILETSIVLNRLFDEIIISLRDGVFDIKKIRTTAFKIQDLADSHRENHLERMKSGLCTPEAGLAYDKFYAYLLRVRDHLINVANQFSTIHE